VLQDRIKLLLGGQRRRISITLEGAGRRQCGRGCSGRSLAIAVAAWGAAEQQGCCGVLV
jgi:hypothetical protein